MCKLSFYRNTLIFLMIITRLCNAGLSLDANDLKKIHVCVVEERGAYRRATKFCPIIESNSNIGCVVGVDRLDCIRRIHKGEAHFGVFSPEDLVAARWSSIEILVTNEMRFHNNEYEYQVAAVVDNEGDIHTVSDLRGSRFCHPGNGIENHFNEILANYFESYLVPRSCDPSLSLAEDRIKSTAKFFGPTCKAGPWVPDPVQDRILKNKYPSLCQLCYDSYRCSIGDKHWGRRGALYCLTSGNGQVAWARLDDIKSHFGLSGIPQEANPAEYSFLCSDGHLQPINSTNPCVWVAKPWQAVAAKRSHAQQVQNLISKLSHDEAQSWQSALLSLIESYHARITTLENTIPIDDYLNQAVGFQSAYSFPECNPPRSIVFCTTSIIQHVKCSWLQEAAQVYGVSPNLQCVRTLNQEICLDDAEFGYADVVLVDHDSRAKAQKKYKLQPLLYEFSQEMHERYFVLAVIKKESDFTKFSDLKGYKACFPSFEGAAHLSVLATIANVTGTNMSAQNYFSKNSCIWDKQNSNCALNYKGDEGALQCLIEGGDVAFISSDVYKNFTRNLLNYPWSKQANKFNFGTLCPYGINSKHSKLEYCYLHWTTRGHLMVRNSSIIRQNEIYNSLRDMDRLFGKAYKEYTKSFTLFGPFDKKNNIIFRDNTDALKGLNELKKDRSERLMENIFHDFVKGKYSSTSSNLINHKFLLSLCLILSLYTILK